MGTRVVPRVSLPPKPWQHQAAPPPRLLHVRRDEGTSVSPVLGTPRLGQRGWGCSGAQPVPPAARSPREASPAQGFVQRRSRHRKGPGPPHSPPSGLTFTHAHARTRTPAGCGAALAIPMAMPHPRANGGEGTWWPHPHNVVAMSPARQRPLGHPKGGCIPPHHRPSFPIAGDWVAADGLMLGLILPARRPGPCRGCAGAGSGPGRAGPRGAGGFPPSVPGGSPTGIRAAMLSVTPRTWPQPRCPSRVLVAKTEPCGRGVGESSWGPFWCSPKQATAPAWGCIQHRCPVPWGEGRSQLSPVGAAAAGGERLWVLGSPRPLHGPAQPPCAPQARCPPVSRIAAAATGPAWQRGSGTGSAPTSTSSTRTAPGPALTGTGTGPRPRERGPPSSGR